MGVSIRSIICALAATALVHLAAGCGEVGDGRTRSLVREVELGPTIGSLGQVLSTPLVAVEGYGLVGGLKGTGSAECPTRVRAYLARYIATQLPQHRIDVARLIASPDTAVVSVQGLMPAIASTGRSFDVRVTALSGTQTTSLDGGWLYRAELLPAGRFVIGARVAGTAAGPVFINKIDESAADLRTGYVPGGGRVAEELSVNLVLREPDYRLTGLIRDLLNERFGEGTARAIMAARIELRVPPRYRRQPEKFFAMVAAMYLGRTEELVAERINSFVRKLAVSDDKYAAEIALETIGSASLGKVGILLNSSREDVRLHAARCMLNLGSDKGLGALYDIAVNGGGGSTRRIEAMEAIGLSARREDAAALLRKLLRDKDFEIVLAASDQLRRLGDASVKREFVGRSFYLDQISQTAQKVVYVCRSGEPRIVLFGSPLYCRQNIFVESADRAVIINAPAGRKYVSLIRRQARRPGITSRRQSSFELADIIRKLCEEPVSTGDIAGGGLGVSYSDCISLLQQMCDKGAVGARFMAGPMPKIDLIVKK
ncbi:MAG: flagellar basal body P-ring protein FlgI [Phycisphaerales bacterium]|nr:MAG: flagellar basal body P-ring protein FlgI [Phycisphaerales bacterium]